MIAVECHICGQTAYTADPVNQNPCPHCGTNPEFEFAGIIPVAKKGVRPLNDIDRVARIISGG